MKTNRHWKIDCFVVLGLCWGLLALGQEDSPERGSMRWLLPEPEVEADPEIPTLEAVVGHAWAEDLTSHVQVERYLQALVDAAPERSRLVRYGESYEGRSLNYLVISDPWNIDRLDEIRENIHTLADPRDLDDDTTLAAETPAIVWLAYSVHGDETSSTDAALITAYTLLADQREATKDRLRKLVVIIDPLQNPDGRERFLNAYREARGTFPASEPLASERTQRWPRGRFNHYLFDMNRDWFLQSQQESKAKVAAYLDWQPQIYVDAHEMGSNNNYFFEPPSDPFNSQLTDTQQEWYMAIGRHHGERFDQYGFAYTTREMFDAFFPGYGSTWPVMQGGIGILWEQAGVRGLVVDKDDETKLHYHDAVRHHYISGLAMIEVASDQKDKLLLDYSRTRALAIDEGNEGPVTDYFLLSGDTPTRAARLAQLLIDNGIEVRQVENATTIPARGPGDEGLKAFTLPVGTFHVSAAQPAGRLVRTLLDRADDMGEAFIERQLDRRARRLRDQIYDVTAWSLPLTFGIDCLEAEGVQVESLRLEEVSIEGKVEGPEVPKVGYLVPAEDEAALRALADWLGQGLRVHVFDQPTTLNERNFGRGTLLLRVAENPETLHEAVRRAASTYGLNVVGTDTSFVDDGAALGGPNVSWVKPPNVLLAVSDPVGTPVGHTWYLFDQVWRYPTTRINAQYLERFPNLDDHDVLVLAGGSYGASSGFGEAAVERLKSWVRQGGTLILFEGAVSWAISERVGFLDSRAKRKEVFPIPGEGIEPEDPPTDLEDEDASDGSAEDGRRENNNDRPTESPDRVPGAFLKATVYPDHWITFGLPEAIDVLINGSLILEPLQATDGRNLVTIQEQSEPVSGFCWPATLELIGRTPLVLYQGLGQGHIVGFTNDPNFRALSPVTSRLFQNAVFFGPGH